jgi:hypothetical protein
MSTTRRDFIRVALALVALDPVHGRLEEIESPFEGKAVLDSSLLSGGERSASFDKLNHVLIVNGRLSL